MTDLDDTEVLSANGNMSTPQTVLDRIRAKRAEHAAKHTLDIEVPGHDGLVGLRLGPVSGRTLSNIAERLDKSRLPDRAFNVTIDTLCAACVSVLVREHEEDEWSELTDGSGMAVALDKRLHDMLGLTAPNQRGLLVELFDGANSPTMAVAGMGAEYSEWASTAEQQITDDALGESHAATR